MKTIFSVLIVFLVILFSIGLVFGASTLTHRPAAPAPSAPAPSAPFVAPAPDIPPPSPPAEEPPKAAAPDIPPPAPTVSPSLEPFVAPPAPPAAPPAPPAAPPSPPPADVKPTAPSGRTFPLPSGLFVSPAPAPSPPSSPPPADIKPSTPVTPQLPSGLRVYPAPSAEEPQPNAQPACTGVVDPKDPYRDSDHNGIPDIFDTCIEEVTQSTGCVEQIDTTNLNRDQDGDGIPDNFDHCICDPQNLCEQKPLAVVKPIEPTQPAGCVEEIDTTNLNRDQDRDGIPDNFDRCICDPQNQCEQKPLAEVKPIEPTQPAGCVEEMERQYPGRDSDGDNQPNGSDLCICDPQNLCGGANPEVKPEIPCPTNEIQLLEPFKDRDEDGTVNIQDNCPYVPGQTLTHVMDNNGRASQVGCPTLPLNPLNPTEDEDKDEVTNENDDCLFVAGQTRFNGCQEEELPAAPNLPVVTYVPQAPETSGETAAPSYPLYTEESIPPPQTAEEDISATDSSSMLGGGCKFSIVNAGSANFVQAILFALSVLPIIIRRSKRR